MAKQPAEVAPREVQTYDPAAKYKPLFDKAGTPQSFMGFFLEEVKPYVPLHILTGDAPEKHIDKLLKVFGELTKRYAQILNEASFNMGPNENLSKVADRVSSGKLRDLSSIWRAAKAAGADKKTFEKLSSLRNEMDAEFLACLGFLPNSIFFPTEEGSQDGLLLKDTISPHVKSGEGISDQMSFANIRRHASDSQLHEWIGQANKDFQVSVEDAFAETRETAQKISPKKGMGSQLFEPLSDFDTKHFADLLVLTLDPKLAPIKRFEAFRLLKWAIAFFSVQRNPVYQALNAARTALHDLLQAELWSSTGQFEMVRLPPDIIYAVGADVEKDYENLVKELKGNGAPKRLQEATEKKVRKIIKEINALHTVSAGRLTTETLTHLTAFGNKLISFLDTGDTGELDSGTSQDAIRVKARKVRTEVQTLLGGELFAAQNVLFSSRGKNIASIVNKLERLKALMAACNATLGGEKVGDLNTQKATEKLREIMDSMLEHGHKKNDLDIKPVGFDALDDQVGLSLVFNLKKPLEVFTKKEQVDLDAQFKAIADHVLGIIPLENVRIENLLWEKNGANPKSSKSYRLYKIHGEYEIAANVFEDGRIVTRRVRVPVEIQLQPIETFLRSHLDPQTSHEAYERKKAHALAPSEFPQSVGEVELYSFVRGTNDGSPIAALMDADAQEDPTT